MLSRIFDCSILKGYNFFYIVFTNKKLNFLLQSGPSNNSKYTILNITNTNLP